MNNKQTIIKEINENKAFFIFLFSSFLTKSISFFLLPFFTKHLSPENYGAINMLNNFTIILTPFIFLSVLQTISSDFFKLDTKSFNKLTSTLLVLPIFNTIIFLIFLTFFKNTISSYFQVNSYLLIIAPIVVIGNFFTELILILFRNNNMPWKYFWYCTLKILFELIISILFILFVFQNEWGRIFGLLCGSVISIPIIYIVFKEIFIISRFDFSLIKKEFFFSLPLIINQFAFSFFLTSDKLFIEKISSISELGNYSVAFQLSFILIIVSNSFYTFFAPKLFQALSIKSLIQINALKKKYYLFVIFMLFISIIIYFFAGFIYEFFIGFKFQSGKKYLLPLMIGLFFWAIVGPIYSIFYYFKNKLLIYSTSILFFILNLGINFFASKFYGINGVVYSMILFYLFFFLVIFIYYNKSINAFIVKHNLNIT